MPYNIRSAYNMLCVRMCVYVLISKKFITIPFKISVACAATHIHSYVYSAGQQSCVLVIDILMRVMH